MRRVCSDCSGAPGPGNTKKPRRNRAAAFKYKFCGKVNREFEIRNPEFEMLLPDRYGLTCGFDAGVGSRVQGYEYADAVCAVGVGNCCVRGDTLQAGNVDLFADAGNGFQDTVSECRAAEVEGPHHFDAFYAGLQDEV